MRSKKYTFGCAAKLLLTISPLSYHVRVEALHDYTEAILKDIMPPISSLCTDHGDFSFQTLPDSWHPKYTAADQLNFMAQLNHDNPDGQCKSWELRIGSGGNMYGLKGCFGETITDTPASNALWVDAVIQAISVNTNLNDNANRNFWFIHQAGVYQNDGITKDDPFFSPSVASHCDDESCLFAGWGQQAWVPTNFTSHVLYLSRYTDCGDGVFEVTNIYHNAADPTEEDSPFVDRFNTPWGGFISSVLKDMLIPDTNNDLVLQYPFQVFGNGDKSPSISETNGYVVFAQDLPIPPTNQVNPFQMPCSGGQCVELIIASDNACQESTAHPERYTVKCPIKPTAEVSSGCERCNLYITNRRTGQGVEVPHVTHWNVGDHFYFHPEDLTGVDPVDLTAQNMNDLFSANDVLDVAYSTVFQMPCASNNRIVPCPEDESAYNDQVIKLQVERDNDCWVSEYHSGLGKGYTVVRMRLYATVQTKDGCDQCDLMLIKKSDPTQFVLVKDLQNWSWNTRFLYFTPYNAPKFTDLNDPVIQAVCDEIDSVFVKDDIIVVKNYDPGLPIEQSNGYSHVFGDVPGIIRYGRTTSQKDFTVYTPILGSRTIDVGDSLVTRQYYIVGNLNGIEGRSEAWANEALQLVQTIGDKPGRKVHVVSSSFNKFGVSLESTTCGNAVVCTGKTTPQPNMVAHFYITCGAQSYFGPDKYHFATMTDAVRPYECNGQPGIRPELQLLGYYKKSDCASLQDAIFDENLCHDDVTGAPTKAPVNAPTPSPFASPTKAPVNDSTANPTKSPVNDPTANPTKAPVNAPTPSPGKPNGRRCTDDAECQSGFCRIKGRQSKGKCADP